MRLMHIQEAGELVKLRQDVIKAMAEKIKSDCAPYINALPEGLGGRILYRGMTGYDTSKDISSILTPHEMRYDRQPRDTAPALSRFVDEWFKQTFGWNARSQAIFATPAARAADEYGTVHAIFPRGKFRYIWGESYHDLGVTIAPFTRDIELQTPSAYARLNELLEYGKWHLNEGLPDAIRNGREPEIMLGCPYGYYAIPVVTRFPNEITWEDVKAHFTWNTR